MTPYRSSDRGPLEDNRPRRHARVPFMRKVVGSLLLLASVMVARRIRLEDARDWAVVAVIAFVGLAMFATYGPSRNSLTRLCRLTWNHGDRVGAVMLFVGVFTPRYSKKRIARNEAAMRDIVAWRRKRNHLG